MARRRRGILSGVGGALRALLWGFAALMVVALYIQWTRPEPPAQGVPGATELLPPATATQTTAPAAPAETTPPSAAPTATAPAETAAAPAPAATDTAPAPTTAAPATTDTTPPPSVSVGTTTSPATPPDTTTATTPTDTAAAPAATEAMPSAGPLNPGDAIPVPTDPTASYALVDLTQADGTVDLTVKRADPFGTTYQIYRVDCATRSLGKVAEGSDLATLSKDTSPTLKPAPTGTTDAAMVAAACGNG